MEKPKTKALVEYRSQGGVDIQLSPDVVRNFLVQGKKELVSAQELMYFMNVCRARKLNPFIKDCYLIKFGSSPAAIVTSVDYFRKNARKSPDCKGWKAGIVVLQNGEITYREGSLILDDETLVGGWAEARPDGWDEPKRHTINLAGYIKKKDGRPTRFWQEDKQPDMIAKVAESQLLRQLWGEETTGMYSAEEMPSIEDIGKTDGPVQSEVKQRIMDGKKQADNPDPDPERELGGTTVVDYPPVHPNAEAAHERNKKRDEERKLKKLDPEKYPKPNEPNIKKPVVEDLTDDQIIATEKAFSMLCKTVKITDADSYRYLKYLSGIAQLKPVQLMRTVIENPKTEFKAMHDWLKGNPVERKPEAETKATKAKGKFAVTQVPFNEEIWNPEKWARKKSSGFSTHVWKNIKTLAGEPDPLIAAVKKKWAHFYKDEFPTVENATLNGGGNGVSHIETETYYEPPKDKPATPAPDKEDDPVEFLKWLRADFPEQYAGAREYLGFADTPQTLSKDAVKRLIKSTEQLIDMENE